MKRREFIGLFGGAITWPLAANAQQRGTLHRIGILTPGFKVVSPAFINSLREFGYAEG